MPFIVELTLFLASWAIAAGFDGWHCLNHDLGCLSGLPHKFEKLLTNKHLVFVGDSLTRYQYMSLVYMLRHKIVLMPDMIPNLVLEKQWPSWIEFFHASTGMLAPNEVCDCYRNGIDFDDMFENRFYKDPALNISVSFFSFVGKPQSKLQGHLLSEDLNNTGLTRKYPSPYPSYAKWQYYQLPPFISGIVNRFTPKADTLVLNYGRWQASMQTEEISEVLSLLKGNGTSFIWKTTTWGTTDHEERSYGEETQKYKTANQVIMDTDWTRQVNSSYYWDIMHFTEPIYSILNSQLYELMFLESHSVVK